jgi:hypothetical protein
MPQTATAKRSILLPCPCCNEPAACVALRMSADAGEDCEFFCLECEAEFGRAEVEEQVNRWAKWAKVLAWADAAPQFDEE